MLFHSSVRKELARSFGATLVVLITVVMTMTLLRTLGEASRGTFNPADVLIIMGYTVLSDMPTILSMCLFIAVLSVLTRMYQDSEMVIWFGSGRGLGSLLAPLLRFAWPILVIILALAFFILPWAFGRIEDLRYQYDKRGDIARIEPGRFQESANGDRVFFIEKDALGQQTGTNVFIATHEKNKETVTSAQTGRIDVIGDSRFLVLNQGQRLERTPGKANMSISLFGEYAARVGADDQSARDSSVFAYTLSTWELISNPTPKNLAEITWRFGLILAALNLVIIGLASAGMNPRAGRAGNLVFAFLAFVVYFNLLVMGKNWIENGQVHILTYLVALHGGTLTLALLWLAKRHYNWTFFGCRRSLAAKEAT